MVSDKKLFIVPYSLSVFSGMAGLIYEIVWSRELVLIFGHTTYSVTSVLSAFMFGLGLGGLVFGKIADKYNNPLKLYAILEIGVALSAFYFIFLISFLPTLYSSIYDLAAQSTYLELGLKFLLSFIAITPATFFMGGTLPTLAGVFKTKTPQFSPYINRLYNFNTIGAIFGVTATILCLIELLGLRGTQYLAILVNLTLGFIALNLRYQNLVALKINRQVDNTGLQINPYSTLLLIIIFISGFSSMSYQALWVRMLIPSLGTSVYSFALVLIIFLIGISGGSFLSEKILKKHPNLLNTLGLVYIGTGITFFISLIISTQIEVNVMFQVMAMLPGTFLAGAIFPLALHTIKTSHTSAGQIGKFLLANIAGSVIGVFTTSLLLITIFGTSKSIILICLLNLTIGFLLIIYKIKQKLTYKVFGVSFISLLLTLLTLRINNDVLLSFRVKATLLQSRNGETADISILEDEVASIVALKAESADIKELFIDGVSTTKIIPETALMAHLPISLHPNPKQILIIGLGMGNTYKSALLHKIQSVTVVELVPSVPKVLSFYQSDYQLLVSDPRGKIIVTDGRNFLKKGQENFDVIIVDPPPPVNSAGTTLLYSTEFYQDAKLALNKDGLLLSWFYADTGVEDYKMLMRSFYQSFPYILVAKSNCNCGFFLIGSESPIKWDKKALSMKLSDTIISNINTSNKFSPLSTKTILNLYQGDKRLLEKFIHHSPPITDLHPKTEYYLLRNLFKKTHNALGLSLK